MTRESDVDRAIDRFLKQCPDCKGRGCDKCNKTGKVWK